MSLRLWTALLLILLGAPVARAQTAPSSYSPRISTGSAISLDHLPGGLQDPQIYTLLASYTFDSGANCVADGWTAVDRTAGTDDVGSFAGMYNGLTVVLEDPCWSNITCLWGFFNGSTDNYACGGFPIQSVVPRGGVAGYVHNEIWSPAIALQGSGARFDLVFDVYRDNPIESLVFYTWRVRSIRSGVPGPWRGRDVVYYGGGKDWLTATESFGDLVEVGADSIQVALGVVDMCGAWCATLGDGICHSHAPLFDNVEVRRYSEQGPRWFVHPVDLFQDNFAGDGTTTGTVRIDMARDINPRTDPAIRPGDSLVVWVDEPSVGLDYDSPGVASSGPAVYLHVKDVSGAKSGAAISGDPARWPLVSSLPGWTVLRFDSVRTAAGPLPGRFCVDLADDLYTPGDTLLFFFSARDAAGRSTYWSEFTGTVASMSVAADEPCEMTCLPAAGLHTLDGILYVDDFDGHGAQPFFDTSFQMLGILENVDRFDVRGPDCLAGNGPGSRVSNIAEQVAHPYRTIIWNSGNLEAGTIGDGTGMPEKSPDASLLAMFLDSNGPNRLVYLSGDDIATELARLAGDGVAGLRSFIDYTLVDDSHLDVGAFISPLVIGEAGGIFDHILGPDTMVAYGGCPDVNDFDVLAPASTSIQQMRYDGGVHGRNGAVISQRSVNTTGNEVSVVLSGFSFHYIRDDMASSALDRPHHLRDILLFRLPPVVPCPMVYFNTSNPEGGVALVEWDVPMECRGLTGLELYRTSDVDTMLVQVHADSTLEASERWFDVDVDPAAINTYRLVGLLPGDSSYVLVKGSVFVQAPFRSFTARGEDQGVRLRWDVPDTPTIMGFTVFRDDGNAEVVLGDSLVAPRRRELLDRTVVPGKAYSYSLLMYYTNSQLLTSSRSVDVTAAASLTLAQNFPNPFNPATTIGYTVPTVTPVEIAVFDVAGRRVATLMSGLPARAGYWEVRWDGRTDGGDNAASGVYFYRMTADGVTLTRKMVLVR